MKYLINFLYGAGNVLELFPEPRHYHVEQKGFSEDARQMRGDFKTVAYDLQKQLSYEPTYHRSR